jgi:hypothetical protein
MRRFVLSALVLCAACDAADRQEIMLLDYRASVPAVLEARPPSSTMRLAEFVVRRDDDAQAEVVVYYFGEGQGGDADANIARWTAQFTAVDGGPVQPRVSQAEGVAFPTTVAEYEGTYARGVGMASDAPARPDQGLVAAVVETPMGNLFLQLFGDRSAVAEVRDDFLQMVGSIRP